MLLVEVVSDMSGFMIVLSFGTIAFIFLFDLMKNEKDTDHIVPSDIFRLVFGDFNVITSNFTLTQFIYLLIMSILMPIVMLNLLIAIIGDTFDRV